MAKLTKKKRKPGKPHTFLAIVCENVLQEGDHTSTFVRVIDLITVRGQTDEMPPGAVQFTIALGFRSGGFRGKKPFSVRVATPAGKKRLMMTGEMDFKDEAGAMAFVKTTLGVKMPGLYYFDVLLDSRRMVQIPIRIAYEKSTIANSSVAQSGQKSSGTKSKSRTRN